MARRRSSATTLARIFEASQLPFYVVDDQRRIIYCNSACAEWLGIAAELLVGQRCDYHVGGDLPRPAELAAQLCPPPPVLAGRAATTRLVVRAADGQVVRRAATFMPLSPERSAPAAVLCLVHDQDTSLAPQPAERNEYEQLHEQLLQLHHAVDERYRLDRLIGQTPIMRRVRAQIAVAAVCSTRVLIVGPPGSGREHVARTIHYSSRGMPLGHLVPLSCSLLDAELLQSTITEFVRRADSLDEDEPAALLLLDVDQLPPDAQLELAGFFELPDFELPVIATSQLPLVRLAQQDQFHRDLAYALSTLVVELPALSERIEDIPLLAQHFLERFNARGGRQLSGFTPEALDELAGYPWPDNLEELAEVVTAACEQASGELVGAADLPARLQHAASLVAHPRPVEETIQLDELLTEVETELLKRALRRAKGNKAQAARLLGVTRARVQRRASQLGLE